MCFSCWGLDSIMTCAFAGKTPCLRALTGLEVLGYVDMQ